MFTGHWNCFLSSVARDGKDGHGLKLENIGPILLLCPKNYQNMSYKVWSLLSDEFFFDIFSITALQEHFING